MNKERIVSVSATDSCYRIVTLGIYCCRIEQDSSVNKWIRKDVDLLMPRIPAYTTTNYLKAPEIREFVKHQKYNISFPNSYQYNHKSVCWGLYRIKDRYLSTNDITDQKIIDRVAEWRDCDNDNNPQYSQNNKGEKDYQVFVLEAEFIFPKPIYTTARHRDYFRYHTLASLFKDEI